MNDFKGITLLIPDKNDVEINRVAFAWAKKGGEVLRISRFWDPPVLDGRDIRIYGNNMFCLILAQTLGMELVSPEDDLLVKINQNWTKRRIETMPLEEARNVRFPAFIKPVAPKIFRAGVYHNLYALATECSHLEPESPVYISEVVDITAEARCFMLKGQIITASIYEGDGDLKEAVFFTNNFINENMDILPETLIIDVGFIDSRGWAIIEANAAWGAGLNGCDAEKAVLSIACASKLKKVIRG